MTSSIAGRVQQRLSASRLNQTELSEKIDLDRSKLSKSLNGTRTFSTGELAAISDALKVDIYWLINGEPSSLSPRFAYRHTFNGDTGTHSKPSDELRQQMDNLVLAYRQADLAPCARLEEFRQRIGSDGFDASRLPSAFPEIRPAAGAVQRLWKDWLGSGKDPVRDIEGFLWDHFGVDLVVADVAGAHRVNAQTVQVAGAQVIVVERSGTWYSTLFGIFHELAHLIFGALAWQGQDSSAGEADFEKFANAFAGDVLLSRDDVRANPIAELPLPDLADFLWKHAIGLKTARFRYTSNGAPVPSEHIRQGDILLQWRALHGDERSNAWGAPSYPDRLIDRHEKLVRAGDVPPDVLAWMLGAPVAEVAVEHEPTPLDEETRALLEQLGIPQ